jgi:hypothetical protein
VYLAQLDENNGRCQQGFMKGPVEAAAKVKNTLANRRNNIYN